MDSKLVRKYNANDKLKATPHHNYIVRHIPFLPSDVYTSLWWGGGDVSLDHGTEALQNQFKDTATTGHISEDKGQLHDLYEDTHGC